jgi:phospholipase C
LIDPFFLKKRNLMNQSDVASKIKNIVVLMLENRSFDHMLGTLPGVNGVLDENGALNADLGNHLVSNDLSSTFYPVTTGAIFVTPENERSGPEKVYGGPAHSFPAATEQLLGTTAAMQNQGGATTSAAPATNCGFVQSYESTLIQAMGSANLLAEQKAGTDPIGEVMQVFTAEQLPAIHALAQEFCVCDQWYSEVPGPTEPNRLFMHAATSTGLTYNPWILDRLTVPTIYDRLTAAGKDWAMFVSDISDADSFANLAQLPQSRQTYTQFFDAVGAGTLPFYSFLCPRYTDSASDALFPIANSQHAPDDVRYGDQLIAQVYNALRAGPGWNETLFVILYDEHGGYYDHVVPPAVAAPDTFVSPNDFMWQLARQNKKNAYLVAPDYQFDFTRLGFRVPAVLVSPWIPKGTIAKDAYRHTSVLKLISELINSAPLTNRDATATSPASLLSLNAARTDCLESVTGAVVGATAAIDKEIQAARLAASPTPKQIEVGLRGTANLPGHPDSGREVERTFSTRLQLSDYVNQRIEHSEMAIHHVAAGCKSVVAKNSEGRWNWKIVDSAGVTLAVSPVNFASQAEAELALNRASFVSQAINRSPTRHAITGTALTD